MTDQRELELLIKAHLEGKGDIEKVTKAISGLEDAIDSQTAAAKRGESSIDQLKATLLSLQQVQDKLAGQQRLVTRLQGIEKAVAAAADRVAASTKKYDDYNAKLAKANEVSDRQQERLIKLSVAAEKAQGRLTALQQTQAGLAAELQAAGIATDNLTKAQDQVGTAIGKTAGAINKAKGAITSYAEDVRQARIEQQKLAAEAGFQQQLRDAAQLAKAAEYTSFWRNALEKVEAAQKRLAEQRALDKVADDALETAKGYSTLQRAATNLNPKITALRDTIREIVDPAGEMRKTLGGVEGEVNKLASSIAQIRGPVSNYREQLAALAQAQKALQSQAGLVDDFRQQTQALRSARAEFVTARAEVRRYAEDVRTGAASTEQLAAAQARLAGAANALQRQTEAARAARSALREAGIESNNLAAAENRLTASAKSATTATQQLTKAQREFGEASRRAGSGGGFSLFNDEGRTTLSLLQRIRGEVLALTAAYVGLQGVIGLATSAIQLQTGRQGLENQIAIAVGNDPQKVAEEIAYIRGQAERLSLVFDDLGKSYAKFLASGTLAGRGRDELRFVFESFAEVGKVAKLTQDDLNGVFKALEQIFSKGKIQAEELRGQLGDRLFGAFGVAADALKDEFGGNLDKALEQGKVTSDFLLQIAARYRELVAQQLPAATKDMLSAQNDLTNAVNDFKVAIADAGFADSYKELLVELTSFLKSEDGKKFAMDIAEGFSAVADVLKFVIKNFDTLATITRVFVEYWLAFKGVQAAALMLDLAKKGELFAKVLELINRRFIIAALLVGAVEAIRYFIEKLGGLEKATLEVQAFFKRMGANIVGAINISGEAIKNSLYNVVAFGINQFTEMFRVIIGGFGKMATAVGKTDLGAKLGDLAASIKVDYKGVGSAVDKARAELNKDLAQIDRDLKRQLAEVDSRQKKNDKPTAAVDRSPTTLEEALAGRPARATPVDETAVKKRQTEVESLTKQVETLEARVDRVKTNTLAKQLEAVDSQYAALERKISGLGGSDGAALLARFQTARDAVKINITNDFNAALLKQQEDLQRKLEELDAAAGRKQKTDLEARKKAVLDSYADTYRQLDDMQATLTANGRDTAFVQAARTRLDAGVKTLQQLEEFKAREAELNAIIATREATLARIEAERKAGILTSAQAYAATQAAIDNLQPSITALTMSSVMWAEEMKKVFDPAMVDAFIAKMYEAEASGKALGQTFIITQEQVEEMLASGLTSAFEQTGQAIAGLITGTMSLGDAFRSAGQAFLKFAADFLREIALMIIKQLILKAIQNSSIGGMIGGGAAEAASGAVAHSGAVIGGVANRTRSVSSAWFGNAPRYHTGGIVGLAPNEVPAILEKNEEVLSKSDPRNILNGGAAAGGSAPAVQPMGVKIINTIDSASVVSEGLSTPEGTRAIMNVIRANRSQVKTYLG